MPADVTEADVAVASQMAAAATRSQDTAASLWAQSKCPASRPRYIKTRANAV